MIARGLGLSALTLFALTVSAPTWAQEKKELATKGWGSLEGKIVLVGKVPALADLTDKMKAHADAACCLAGKAGEKVEQTWVIDAKTKGVGNVFIYLKADAGTYFPIHPKEKTRTKPAEIDQPNCAFVPHVVAHFPSFYDGAKMVSTGEKFIVKNSATVTHNARGIGDPLKNPGFNINLPAGKSLAVDLKPQRLPLMLQCDIHPWMNGKIMVFDHPYFAVTKADGTFSIPHVPAGAEVSIMAWHEGVGYVLGKDGKKVTFKEGKNKYDAEIKAPE